MKIKIEVHQTDRIVKYLPCMMRKKDMILPSLRAIKQCVTLQLLNLLGLDFEFVWKCDDVFSSAFFSVLE